MNVIAVHGTNGLAQRWPTLIQEFGLEYRRVNGYANSIIDDLRDCDALLWHVSQDNVTDLRFARSVLLAAARLGLQTYPNHPTVWHFDDKAAQKYLLESIGAPLADTWVFYDPNEAREFIEHATYPLVWKLRGGAGSLNVRLLRNRDQARNMVTLMFGKGVPAFPPPERYKPPQPAHGSTTGTSLGCSATDDASSEATSTAHVPTTPNEATSSYSDT